MKYNNPKFSWIKILPLAFLLMGLSVAHSDENSQEAIIFKLQSDAGVRNGPINPTIINIDKPTIVTKIWTYHWNEGRGAAPGTISLRDTKTGKVLGSWTVVGNKTSFDSTPGARWPITSSGPPYLYWGVQPRVQVPAGTYEVVDSSPSTWSTNGEMRNQGCAWVFGMPGTVQSLPQSSALSPVTLGDANGVTITAPGGLLAGNAKLTVVPSKTAAQLPKPNAAAKILGAYDVGLGGASNFDREITIEIPYDPAALDPNLPEGKNLWVSSWDSKNNLWSLQRAEVDTVRKRLIVHTNHLSTWIYWTLQGYKYVESSEKVIPVPTMLPATSPLPASALVVYYHPGHVQPRTDVARDYTMKDLANDALLALIVARKSYQAEGFKPLDYQVNAIITDTSDSNMDPLTGVVLLKRTSLKTLALLRHDSGHELFHVVQNRYFNVWGMRNRLWWIEGTPDYASAVIAWKEGPTPLLDPTYFDESLFLNQDTHAYQNDQFIHYLVTQRKLSFKGMWDAIVNNSKTGDNGAPAFQNYVSSATGKSFAQVWTDFVDYAMFGARPLGRAASPSITITDKAAKGSVPMVVPSYAAKGVFVRVQSSSGALINRVKLSSSALVDGATVEIWRVQLEGKGLPDRRTGKLQKVLIAGDTESPVFDLDSKNGLEAIVINPGPSERNVTVTAQSFAGPLVTLTPSKIENAENEVYNFLVKIDNLAAAIVKVECEWDFGDGSDQVSFSSTGLLKDGYISQVSHRFNRQDANLKVKAKIYDRTLGRVLLTEATAQISFAKEALRTVKMHIDGFDSEVTGYFQGDKLVKRQGITKRFDAEGVFEENEYRDGKKVHAKAFNSSNGRLMGEAWFRGDDEFEYRRLKYSWNGTVESESRRLDKNSKWQVKTSSGEWY